MLHQNMLLIHYDTKNQQGNITLRLALGNKLHYVRQVFYWLYERTRAVLFSKGLCLWKAIYVIDLFRHAKTLRQQIRLRAYLLVDCFCGLE